MRICWQNLAVFLPESTDNPNCHVNVNQLPGNKAYASVARHLVEVGHRMHVTGSGEPVQADHSSERARICGQNEILRVRMFCIFRQKNLLNIILLE